MGRGIQRKTLGDDAVGPEKLSVSLRRQRFFEERFGGIQPFAFTVGGATPGYGNPTGTIITKNIFDTGRYLFEYAFLAPSTNAVILLPIINTEGALDLGGDQELAHGMEIVFGSTIATAACPRNYTIGTDQLFFRAKLNIEDVSGVDLYIGMRKCEAFAAAIATYTDLFAVWVLGDSSSAAGQVSCVSNLNDATDVTERVSTSHTVADLTDAEFEVGIVGRSAYFRIDGEEIVPVATFTADSGDIYTPFLFLLNTTDLAGKVNLLAVQGGAHPDDRSEALL